jgi:isopentenyl-diphosphate delta-isomerase
MVINDGMKYDVTEKMHYKCVSQLELMERDQVLVIDEEDNVIGFESKRKSHEFLMSQPKGILHRAFSVFIFDELTGDLLIQKRSSSKITFPSVWTNTCCSHPLHGMNPPEVDHPNDIIKGSVPGTKNAAIRKLKQELGIPSSQIPFDRFKFLTRIHYCATDNGMCSHNSHWGEHEIDYILFLTVPCKKTLTMKPNPDEVDEVKWVSKEELVNMFADRYNLFSPWFYIILKKCMICKDGWWEDLHRTMVTDLHSDYRNIYRFDQ